MEAESKNKKSVALVEDEAALLSMYETKFKMSGFDVFTATNGKDGLMVVQQKKPSLVLLDILMPGISGFEVLEDLKKDENTKTIPVVLLTNLSEDAGFDKGQALGADGYVMKVSCTPERLVHLANAIISSSKKT